LSTLSNQGKQLRASSLINSSQVFNLLRISLAAVTMNNHRFGVTPQSFASDLRLSSMFNVLSTNVDRYPLAFL
jgi:hypothetical protein